MSEVTTPEPADFNPFLSEFVADPYPTYSRLREAGRVHWMFPGVWLLTRYEDVVVLLRDDRISADPTKSKLFESVIEMSLGGEGAAIKLMRHLLLFMDPPDHTRMRTLVNAAFSRRAVEELRNRIETIVTELLDEATERGEIELMADFAYPLPVTVIAEMLGVPVEDRDRFGAWSHQLIELFGTEDNSPETVERGNTAVTTFHDYVAALADERRREPREDLLTALVEVEEEGERLNNEELLATCILLLIAGHETTANLIGNGTLALLRHPAALARLREDRSLLSTSVEELLRYDSPVQATARTTLEPIEIAGQEIGELQRVAVMLGSANRDPRRFDDSDDLLLDRSPDPHLSFGGGIHFCLGAPLARLEARIAFASLVHRAPKLALITDDHEWRTMFPIRGLKTLPVTL